MTTFQLKPINQQVVAVVGASSGIGRSTALKFAGRGAKVVVASRSQPGLDSLVDEIRAAGGDAIAVVADVADFAQVRSIAEKAVQQYGRIDTWVHAAATGLFARFEQIQPDEFKRVIEVNLLGQVYGAMVALPHLKQIGQGAFISVSSVEARRSLPLQSPYSSSKHGLQGFLDAMRVELKHDGVPVSVTEIMPSTINTPFYNKGKTKLGVKPQGVPPFYHPDQVADAILYAAEHQTRDLIVGDSGRVLDFIQRLSPALGDFLVQMVAVEGQHTPTTKYEDDPNNLYEPISGSGYDRIEGDFGGLTIPSFLEVLDFHPIAKWGTVAGIGALMLLATGLLGGRENI
ncbi:SDR family oxidoreductase [Leptolyngbya sp. FACHB-711]|uniref:SDR family oxidoreductase n=1 Tax=unclassified Leptolyngbya TaxID=2650499 RepID=UPI0016871EDB|nr:SDR family oxidoreductase [Leptolyngbya sp. FACHB-711]MBD1849884.1 SDR family oxidoreductase [Cyanobacteria bacterium FACHB-502]MBD2023650.1 SDR family oxidoreductase [Leptolyngbya sp. FACHB-711]